MVHSMQHATAAEGCSVRLQVSTTDGFTVEAPNVVLATNSPIHHNVLVHSRQKPWK